MEGGEGWAEPSVDYLKQLEAELVEQGKRDAEEALATISREELHDSPVQPGLHVNEDLLDWYAAEAFSDLGGMDMRELTQLYQKYKEAFRERFHLGGSFREQ